MGLLKSRYSHDKAEMSMSEWIIANTKLNGRSFSFARYPFQRKIADDMHPNLAVIKPSQIGMTEIQIRKILAWLMRNNGVTAIYTMPDDDMFKRVSQGRVQPIITKDPVFFPRKGEKQIRSRDIMQFRDSWLYLTGASEGDATSISADAVFNDEVDLTDQELLALFQSRLQGSIHKINHKFSTPTFNNFGIDLDFNGSDQHSFFVKCDSCNHWQVPLFERKWVNIPGLPDDIEDLTEIDDKMTQSPELDLVNSFVMCEQCHNPLDLGREDNREWIAKYPSRTHARGYQVSPFSTNRLPPSYIVQQLLNYKKREAIRRFHNTVLGNAYTGADERLTETQITAALKSPKPIEVGSMTPVWVGIDIGLICHLVLGAGHNAEDMEPFLMQAIPYGRLLDLLTDYGKKFNIVGGCLDRLPYTPTANEIREKFNCRIMPVQYTGKRDITLIQSPEKRPDYAQVDRTNAIDVVFNKVKRGAMNMSGYGTLKTTIVEHLRDMVREEEPEKQAVWKKLSGNDHFFHALTYLHLAPRVLDVVRNASDDDVREVMLFGNSQFGGDLQKKKSRHDLFESRRGSNGPLG